MPLSASFPQLSVPHFYAHKGHIDTTFELHSKTKEITRGFYIYHSHVHTRQRHPIPRQVASQR